MRPCRRAAMSAIYLSSLFSKGRMAVSLTTARCSRPDSNIYCVPVRRTHFRRLVRQRTAFSNCCRSVCGGTLHTTTHRYATFPTSAYSSVVSKENSEPSHLWASPSHYQPHQESPTTIAQDTIFALATGNAGPAGVAVVRISGPNSSRALEMLTASGSQKNAVVLPPPRRAVVRRLYDPRTRDLLDEALILWMPGPQSFTGEDTVELHTHGSRAVINGVLDALGALDDVHLPGAGAGGGKVRLAERGEFTQRAYANGRMDLTGVEGLADLIAADTAAQRKQALRQMGGALRDMYESWRTELKGCLAHAEAVIDFGDDEEDVNDNAFTAILPRVAELAQELDNHLRDGRRGEIVRSGVRVAIVGPPNAGKSTLLNLLSARPAAIVSPTAGTTRDVVEVQMDIAGLPVMLSDTAGLRESTEDEIEREGMRRARGVLSDAHLAIFVMDSTDPNGDDALDLLEQVREEAGTDCDVSTREEGDGVLSSSPRMATDVIVVANKADLLVGKGGSAEEGDDGHAAARRSRWGVGVEGGREKMWRLSCKTREGLEEFVGHLEAEVQSRFQSTADDESPLITRRRHREHVEGCLKALRAAGNPSLPMDLAAEELRIASSELGRITGAVGVEELLDVIFRDFCIGK